MTNEEAIKYLTAKLECLTRSKGFREKCDSYNSYEGCYECDLAYKQGNIGEQIESLKVAIKVLEQYSRFRACANCGNAGEDAFACHECEDYSNFEAKPKEKVGHWIRQKSPYGDAHTYECSECGRTIYAEDSDLSDFPYCHCGARMEE